MALSNTNFDGILSGLIPAWTQSNYESLFVRQNAVWMHLLQQGQIQAGGYGTKIVCPIKFPTVGGPHAQGVTNAYADVTAAPQGGKTAAEYPASEYIVDVSVEEFDLDKFGSMTGKVDWVESQFEYAIEDFMVQLEDAFWKAPENASSAGARNQLASIQTLINSGVAGTTTDGGALPAVNTEQTKTAVVSATGTTAIYTVGGINRNAAGAAYWCPNMFGTDVASEALTVQVLSKGYSKATVGAKHPKLIIVSSGLWDLIQYFASVGGSSGGRFYNDSKLARLGYDALGFMGAEIIHDDKCPTAGFVSGTATAKAYQVFWLNTDHITLKPKTKRPTFRRVDDPRPLRRWEGRMVIALVSNNTGRVHSRHVNITAPS